MYHWLKELRGMGAHGVVADWLSACHVRRRASGYCIGTLSKSFSEACSVLSLTDASLLNSGA